ncbi:hypothetical protein HYW42_03235 [Candidatus Daviesbacteria bacterium]|nr:hypothetical protein [Candidatus Daviesbacteria bacterium]
MDFILPPILAAFGVTFTLLFIRERKLRQKVAGQSSKEIEENRQKGYQFLHQAIKKSQEILSLSETESIKLISESKANVGKIEEEHKAQLAQYVKQYESMLSQTFTQANQAISSSIQTFSSFVKDLEKNSVELEETNQQAAQQRIEKMLDQLETRLSDFLLESEQKTTGSIELELQSVRQLIESYKQQQFKLIDENIVAMMERTMALVLGKRLSLKDQLDLIYESLEKAKMEKFVA